MGSFALMALRESVTYDLGRLVELTCDLEGQDCTPKSQGPHPHMSSMCASHSGGSEVLCSPSYI